MSTLCGVPLHVIVGLPALEQPTHEIYSRPGLDGVGLLPLGWRAEPTSVTCIYYGTWVGCSGIWDLLVNAVGTAGNLVESDPLTPLTLPVRVLSVAQPTITVAGLCTISGATHRLEVG